MGEELQSLVQIIELYGRGLGGLEKAIRFSVKIAEKGLDLAKVKRMQQKMKLPFYDIVKYGAFCEHPCPHCLP